MAEAQALALSCMDLRYIDETVMVLNDFGLHNSYDHIVIAGAAIGVTHADKFTAPGGAPCGFRETFLTHVELAKALHNIKEIILVQHMDCGAAKHVLKQLGRAYSREAELQLHTDSAAALAEVLKGSGKPVRAVVLPSHPEKFTSIQLP
jgi:carbonic anhydrase